MATQVGTAWGTHQSEVGGNEAVFPPIPKQLDAKYPFISLKPS